MEASVFTRERPVFVAADGRRARLVRYGGALAALLACLWLVALAIGMLGTGGLPGVSLPSVVRGAPQAPLERAPAKVKPYSKSSPVAAAKPTARPDARAAARTEPVRQTARTRKSPARPTRRATPARSRNVAEPTPPAQVTEAPPVTQPAPTPTPAPAPAPPPPQQGWARQGYTASPGQTRRAEAQQPVAPAPVTSPQPAPAPPGQQKKAEEPKG